MVLASRTNQIMGDLFDSVIKASSEKVVVPFSPPTLNFKKMEPLCTNRFNVVRGQKPITEPIRKGGKSKPLIYQL